MNLHHRCTEEMLHGRNNVVAPHINLVVDQLKIQYWSHIYVWVNHLFSPRTLTYLRH